MNLSALFIKRPIATTLIVLGMMVFGTMAYRLLLVSDLPTIDFPTIRVQAKFAANVQPDTVWSWNAIGKRKRAWTLSPDAPESNRGFLLNHLISDLTPRGDYANADPVTGQAAWFDLRVSVRRIDAQHESSPQFATLAYAEADEAPLRYGVGMRIRQHASKARP